MAGKFTTTAGKHVRGIPELKERLKFLRDQKTLDQISYRATFGTSKDVRTNAQMNVVSQGLIDSGALLKHIAMKRIKTRTQIGYTVGVRAGTVKQIRKTKGGQNDDPWYWWFLEFGTSQMAAKPFLRPAFEGLKTRGASQIIRMALAGVNASAEAAIKRFRSPK